MISVNVTAALDQAGLRLLSPRERAVLQTNAPTLVWAGSGERFEVWIDGFRMEELPGDRNSYVTFPLSFGQHRWKLVALRGQERTESREGSFRIDDAPLSTLPPGALLVREHWWVQSAITAGDDGSRMSLPGIGTGGWASTSLPATALTALVRNGIYPNPYVGLNNTRIPDTHDGFNADFGLIRYSHIPGKNPWSQPYWFRNSFKVPDRFDGKRVWLTFNEINYRADVWLNGAHIAQKDQMVGMERTFRIDVTAHVKRGAENFLAVEIHPLDVPGRPEPAPVTPLADPGRNMGADADISLNYTKWDTIGWDWQPEIRDRDIGITEDVYLSSSEEVEIADLYVASDFNPADPRRAPLLLSCDVVNHGDRPQYGTLQALVSDESGKVLAVEQSISVDPGATRHVEWTPQNSPAFTVANPRLWWPATLGEPHLYTLKATFHAKSGMKAQAETSFGIRKLETYLSPVTHTRVFRVNGRDLYGQGGNWVIDMMLNGTASRYEQEIMAAREARLNFLRVWGPTGAPPECFYDAADRLGVMIQQDFLHDHWGTDQNKPGFEPPLDIFEAATTAIIKKYRNHPSLFLWCGGNEGPNPREDLIKNHLLVRFDPWGGRYYLSASLADGLQGGGPYHNLPADKYFDNPKIAGFNSEIGPSGVPDWDSLRQFLPMPPASWAKDRFPLDGAWAYHDATDRPGETEDRKFSHLDDLIRRRFGAPATTDLSGAWDYAQKAQLLNYETYRSAIEALNQHLWERSTGFALWKFNSSWPSVLWQVTDWYGRLHAGSYALRRALEPTHVQLNLNDYSISVVNRTEHTPEPLALSAHMYDAAMNSVWDRQDQILAAAGRATATSWTVPHPKTLAFLRLRLAQGGRTVSENFYWLAPNDDFSGLSSIPKARVVVSVEPSHSGDSVRVRISNNDIVPAILVHLKLIDALSGAEALPSFWSDNYLNLLPGESTSVVVRSAPGAMWGQPAIEVSGYNVDPVRLAEELK